jgi:hypothetical protein
MVLDIRISRLVQMIHVIQERTEAEHKLRRTELTWQTRNICLFMAATVEDNGARKEMISSAQRLTLLEDELDDTSTEERTLEDIIENGNIQEALARNNQRKGPTPDAMRMSAP